MSTTTLKLPFKRFVAQVSSAPARSKSSYLSLMAENLEALKKCPWREAAAVPVSLTGHDFTASTQFSDAYDAYKLTGNYETATMTEIAYAGMAAYRFKIPASAMTGSVPVASVSLPVSRDRFLKDGLHVAAAFSTSAEPSADWETIRGSGALAASSVLAQSAATLMEGSADTTTVTLDLSGVSSGNPAAYLWVYVTLEDYTDRWTMYNAKEKRLYAVEGSAMLAGDGAEVTFDGVVTADSGETERYLATPIPVRVAYWKYPTMPKLRFRTLHWMGYGNWRHLAPTGEWTFPAGTSDFPFVCDLETTGRRIPTGDCVLECWIDEGGGEFKPGMPYGCAILGGLTATSTPERTEIELARTSPCVVRINLAEAMRAATFDAANAVTDRGKRNTFFGFGANRPLPDGTTSDLSGFNVSSLTRVRIVRNGFIYIDSNGNDAETTSQYGDSKVVFDAYSDLAARPLLTEADVYAFGWDRWSPSENDNTSNARDEVNLDWGTLNTAFNNRNMPSSGLKNALYRIVIGEGETGETASGCTENLPLLFSNAFTAGDDVAGGRFPMGVADEALVGKVYSGFPRFRWMYTDSINRTYPQFRLYIHYVPDSGSGEPVSVYDSGPLRAPIRDADGYYEWTAPIRVGDAGLNDHVFASGMPYIWGVELLDEKYFGSTPTTINSSNGTPFTFASS